MIIDWTQQFGHKLEQFQKQLVENSRQQKQQKQILYQFKVQEGPIQYQLALKYAQDVKKSLTKIHQLLSQKKDSYFSNAAYNLNSFTNQERNQFDQQTKEALKICSIKINELRQSAQRISQNISINKKGKSINVTSSKHLKQIVICLHQYFKQLQVEFGQFLKYNQIKKRKILSTLSIQPHRNYKQPQYFQTQKQKIQENNQYSNINLELEQQANMFYLQKIQDQKKTLQTKQTIQNITEILEDMSKKVLDQELLTSSFQQIGSIGLNFIAQGNKNLVQANNLSKQGGKYWILLFLSLAFSLLIIDFLNS